MPSVNIPNVGVVNFPDDMSQEDITKAIETDIIPNAGKQEESPTDKALRLAKEDLAKPTPEGGFWAAMKAGKEQALADATRLAGRTGLMDTGEAETSAQAREKKASEIFQGTQEGWLEAPWQKLKETAGGSIPYMVAPLVAGAALGSAPVSGALGIGAGAAGAIGAGLASLGQFTGTHLTSQVKGEPESGVAGKNLADTDLGNAVLAAVPAAALDVLSLKMMPGIQRVFKNVGKEITEEEAKQLAMRSLREKIADRGIQVAKTAGIEGGTEAGQEFFNRLQAGFSLTDEKAREQYIENFIGGAVLGGVGRTFIGEPRNIKPGEPVVETPQYTQQGEMFPAELEQAQQAVAGIQGPAVPPPTEPPAATPTGPAPQQGELELGGQDLFGAAPIQPTPAPEPAPTPEAATPSAPEGQGTLPLVGGRTQEQQIVEMYVAEQNNAAVNYAKQKQAEREAAGAEADRLVGVEKQKLRSDIAELDNRIRNKQEKTAEESRLGLLLPLIEDTSITNIPKAFDRALRAAGVTNPEALKFTPREQNLINRAYDVRNAEKPIEVEPSTPNEMDVYTPYTQAEPQQLGLPGTAAPKGMAAQEAPVAESEAKPEQAIVTESAADELNLPKASIVRKNIIGKDLFNPEEREYVRKQLMAARDAYAARSGPAAKAVVDNINGILASSPFVRVQGELFGPKGGANPKFESALPEGMRNVNQRPTAEPAAQPGTSQPAMGVGVPSQPQGAAGTQSTAGVRTPEQRGLERTSGGAEPDVAGTAVPPAAVEPKKAVDPFAAMAQQIQQGIENPPEWAGKTLFKNFDPLINTEGVKLKTPLSQTVSDRLQAGDLVGALREYAKETKGIMGRIAMLLSTVMGNTKVNVVSSDELARIIKERSGQDVTDADGAFFRAGNEIFINADTGLNAHTLLHESTHAATSKILNNPNHPVTKQLNKLFSDVKDALGTAYGATDLNEFVSEVYGNEDFRNQLDNITVEGKNITALQKFMNTVGNMLRRMLGMPAKPISSALDSADRMIASILSPNAESTMGMGYQPVDFLKAAGEINSKLPEFTEKTIDNFDRTFRSTLPGWIKKLLRMSLPLNALADIAVKYIPLAHEVEKLINLKNGKQNLMMSDVNEAIRKARAWAASKTKDYMGTFNNVVYTSTTEQVDPSKPRDTYKGNAEKLAAWNSMQDDWKALGEDGQRKYKEIRDSYKKLYDQIHVILENKMADEMGSPGAAKAVNDALRRIMDNAGVIDPYFPLTRQGDFWLSYVAPSRDGKSTELYVEAFETPRARQRAMDALAQNDKVKDIEAFAKPTRRTFRNAPSSSFMGSVLKTLELNKVPDTAVEEVMNLFLNVMPESSFAQSFRQRADTKGRLGFDQDVIGALEQRMPSIARQLVNLEYGAKLTKLNSQIQEGANESRNDTAKEFADELDKRIQFAISPTVPKWSQVMTSLGFNMTLGFNVSSAIVNMTQIPLIVMPYLGGKYGYGETSAAIGQATKDYINSGFSRATQDLLGQTSDVRAAPSLDNYDFSKATGRIKRYETLARVAGELGQLGKSLTQDILDINGSNTLLEKVNSVTGFAFHHGERMNRQVSMMAAYNLELDRLEKSTKPSEKGMTQAQREEAAANYAVETTTLLNGATSSASAPRIAQNGIGRVAFMFKRYGASMYYMMFKTAREALQSQDKEVRSAAMRQLAGIFGSAAVISGVRGLPMFGIAALAYDAFKDDDDDDFRTAMRKQLGEEAYSGALNAITGLEIASRVGLSDLLFRDNNTKPNQSTVDSLLEMMGGPVVGVALRAERGLKLIKDGEVTRGVEQMLPSAIANGLKAVRYGTEGTTTLRGDPITGEVSAWNVGAQAFGFAPAEYTRQLEINANLKGIDRAAVESRTKMLRQFYIAARAGDSGEMQDVLERIQKFNSKHPTAAITGDTIRTSMAQHAKSSAMMQHGVLFNKRMYPELMQRRAEFEGN